jgi:hypothetical protein
MAQTKRAFGPISPDGQVRMGEHPQRQGTGVVFTLAKMLLNPAANSAHTNV